ncbi:AraC family transcriptional regulator [Nereida sp. MMG025]|uniref:helix-turn-helix transcriptional regulator n=1 Tax=Nereida sp. MMG025 TaxID=2909981 RepID=UPI001F1DD08A|nr:AraC family transcriptional regulator [Nereida sp. MMG025]MCF6445885.1 AraC family transcriptional regulator [Nereida sp. MMG025]
MDKTTFQIDTYIGTTESFHFARKRLDPRFPELAHDHDCFEVFLIESGRTSHWINGTTQTLEPGQLVFIRPHDVHAFSADRTLGCEISNVMFRQETAAHLAARYADTIERRFFDARTPLPEMHTLAPARFARAINVSKQLQTAHRSLARIEEYLLVLTNRVANVTTGISDSTPKWFAEACSAAQSKEVFQKGVAGFISAAGRSHEHVCRTCKTVTGLTPSDYINQIRIEFAAHLLRSDEKPINDIVEDCGFDNTSYFYRLFRQQYGTTPRQYRLKNLRDPFKSDDIRTG